MSDVEDGELAAFCAAQHRRLVGALTLYCGDPGVAAELAQEALARACARWPQVRSMDAPGAWVHRVAINLATSSFRRRRAERAATVRLGGHRHPSEDTAELSDLLAVRRAVAALPSRQRAAIVLRYFSDLSVEDTATAMKCAPGTVKALTSQGITSLRASGLADLEEAAHG